MLNVEQKERSIKSHILQPRSMVSYEAHFGSPFAIHCSLLVGEDNVKAIQARD